MNEIKHTPLVADGERIRLEDGTHIATVWAKYPAEDRLDGESWIDMRQRTAPDRELAEITAKNRAKEFAAASDAILALEMLSTEADAGTAMIPSALRLTIDAALIKAGRKAAPVRSMPCETCGGRGEVGGWRQGDGYGSDPCPDCSATSNKAAPEPVRHVTIAGVDR